MCKPPGKKAAGLSACTAPVIVNRRWTKASKHRELQFSMRLKEAQFSVATTNCGHNMAVMLTDRLILLTALCEMKGDRSLYFGMF